MLAPGSKEVTRQKALGSVQCVQDPGRENHHLICQLTAVRLTAAARHKWKLWWVRRSSYCFTSPASGSMGLHHSTTDSIFADLWGGGGCMTSSSEPQVLEALRFLTCHVTSSTQFNSFFKRFLDAGASLVLSSK